MKMKKISLKISILAFFILNIVACTTSDDPTIDAASIRTADVTLSSPTPLSKADFLDELYDLEEFVHQEDDFYFFTDTDMDTDEFTTCFVSNFGDSLFISGTIKGVRLDSDFPNVQNCFANLLPGATLSNISISILIDNMVFIDGSGNEVAMLGKKMTLAKNLRIKEGNMRMWFSLGGNIIVENETIDFNVSAAFSQNHINGIDQPCTFISPLNNCRSAAVFKFTSKAVPDANSEDGYLVVANNLYFSAGDQYFYDGTIDFTINDWQGEMQYGSTGNVAPTYTASNGNESASGTYDITKSTVLNKVSSSNAKPRSLVKIEKPSVAKRISSMISQSASISQKSFY